MAGLNGHHEAKVMKDAFSSKRFFPQGKREKNQGCFLAGCGFRWQGTKIALVTTASWDKKGKTVILPDPLCICLPLQMVREQLL